MDHRWRSITLGREAITEACDIVDRNLEYWASQPGHYDNTWRSHFSGKLGEFAWAEILERDGFTIHKPFRASTRQGECDITIFGFAKTLFADVKTWSEPFWVELGRCVAEDQFERLSKKAQAILWARVQGSPAQTRDGALAAGEAEVLVGAWSGINDIRWIEPAMTGGGRFRAILNRQLAEADLRGYAELAARLRGERQVESQSAVSA